MILASVSSYLGTCGIRLQCARLYTHVPDNDALDVLFVPEGVQQQVRCTKRDYVCNHVFPEIMVNSVQLLLGEQNSQILGQHLAIRTHQGDAKDTPRTRQEVPQI